MLHCARLAWPCGPSRPAGRLVPDAPAAGLTTLRVRIRLGRRWWCRAGPPRSAGAASPARPGRNARLGAWRSRRRGRRRARQGVRCLCLRAQSGADCACLCVILTALPRLATLAELVDLRHGIGAADGHNTYFAVSQAPQFAWAGRGSPCTGSTTGPHGGSYCAPASSWVALLVSGSAIVLRPHQARPQRKKRGAGTRAIALAGACACPRGGRGDKGQEGRDSRAALPGSGGGGGVDADVSIRVVVVVGGSSVGGGARGGERG